MRVEESHTCVGNADECVRHSRSTVKFSTACLAPSAFFVLVVRHSCHSWIALHTRAHTLFRGVSGSHYDGGSCVVGR
eukprot:3889939-Rhodomonas_salina.2